MRRLNQFVKVVKSCYRVERIHSGINAIVPLRPLMKTLDGEGNTKQTQNRIKAKDGDAIIDALQPAVPEEACAFVPTHLHSIPHLLYIFCHVHCHYGFSCPYLSFYLFLEFLQNLMRANKSKGM